MCAYVCKHTNLCRLYPPFEIERRRLPASCIVLKVSTDTVNPMSSRVVKISNHTINLPKGTFFGQGR